MPRCVFSDATLAENVLDVLHVVIVGERGGLARPLSRGRGGRTVYGNPVALRRQHLRAPRGLGPAHGGRGGRPFGFGLAVAAGGLARLPGEPAPLAAAG